MAIRYGHLESIRTVRIPFSEVSKIPCSLSVRDKEGTLNPEAVLTVTAETSGARTILGFGSADPKSEENYFDKTIRTWHGRALIVTRGEGELKIEVK